MGNAVTRAKVLREEGVHYKLSSLSLGLSLSLAALSEKFSGPSHSSLACRAFLLFTSSFMGDLRSSHLSTRLENVDVLDLPAANFIPVEEPQIGKLSDIIGIEDSVVAFVRS